MTAFSRYRKKGLEKAKIKDKIIRLDLAPEPDPLERWLMAFWVPLGLRRVGKYDFIFAYEMSYSSL